MTLRYDRAGRAKRIRWEVALHEAAHALAYSRIGQTWARATVYRGGRGLCFHGRVADLFADAVCVAAGWYGQGFASYYAIPQGRPRGRRGPKPDFARGKSDAAHLAIIQRISELDAKLGEAARPLDRSEIEKRTDEFVSSHADEIVALARVIFRRGVAFVPALKVNLENRPAACAAGHNSTIAAVAAEGSVQ